MARRSLWLAACLWLLAPSYAGAKVTLGPDLSTPGTFGYSCQEGVTGVCSFVHLPATGGFPAAAPSRGVITRWRFRASCCIPAQTVDRTITLRTFRQTFNFPPYTSARAVRSGATFTLAPGGVLGADTIVDLSVRVRIDAGELVGVNAEYPIGFNGFGGAQMIFIQPAPADGAEGYNNLNGALSMNVDVEPDADGDGYGDETQDCQPGDPGSHIACTPPPSGPGHTPVGGGGPCVGVCGGGGAVFPNNGPVLPITRGAGVFVPVACPKGHTGNCGGFLVASLPGATSSAKRKRIVLGRAKFSVKPGHKKRVTIKFNRRARRLFAEKRTRQVVFTLKPDGGDPITIKRKITLRKRR
jgi:hypothetical protein